MSNGVRAVRDINRSEARFASTKRCSFENDGNHCCACDSDNELARDQLAAYDFVDKVREIVASGGHEMLARLQTALQQHDDESRLKR